MKQALFSMIVLAALLLVALVPHTASAAPVALGSTWQIITTKDGTATIQFEAKDLMNITVYPPKTLTTGSIRNLVIWSESQKQELVRYTLGYYPSGNQTLAARNVSVNLGAFPALIRGDTLQLQIQNAGSIIEYTTAISISVDINALLDQQKQFFLGLITAQGQRIDLLQWELNSAVDTQNRYIMMLAIVVMFVIAYVTRDQWLHKKRKTEEEKSTQEFELFLEQLVLERHQPGDK